MRRLRIAARKAGRGCSMKSHRARLVNQWSVNAGLPRLSEGRDVLHGQALAGTCRRAGRLAGWLGCSLQFAWHAVASAVGCHWLSGRLWAPSQARSGTTAGGLAALAALAGLCRPSPTMIATCHARHIMHLVLRILRVLRVPRVLRSRAQHQPHVIAPGRLAASPWCFWVMCWG